MSYTMYTPLNVWLDPASITDVVAYIQTYLRDNPIYSEAEIEEQIHDYLIAHPELIGGVQSVNGKTGTVVLSASDINTENNVTIESVLASLSSQISSIAASVATNTANITSLTGRMTTAETDLTNLKSNLKDEKLLEQSDLLIENSNFVVDNGSVYAVSVTSPYNYLVIPSQKVRFKYRRRSSTFQLFVGVYIDDFFVGCATGQNNTTVSKITNYPQGAYSNATLNIGIADTVYGSDYNDYTAIITGQVFELKRNDTTILKFTVDDGITIKGFAVLNYQVTYDTTTDNTDLKDVYFELNAIKAIKSEIDNINITGLTSKHRVVCGAVRNAGSGWGFIVDNQHAANLNALSVSSNENGQLIIDFSLIAKKIISFIIAPDENFSALGYFVGASVGTNRAVCEIYKSVPASVSAAISYDETNSEFVLNSPFNVNSATWDSTSGRLIITHSTVDNNSPLISATPFRFGKDFAVAQTWSATQTYIKFFDIATGNPDNTPSTKMETVFCRTNPKAISMQKVDANTINNAYANFWFMGLFEV